MTVPDGFRSSDAYAEFMVSPTASRCAAGVWLERGGLCGHQLF
jgi:hypothetical protein